MGAVPNKFPLPETRVKVKPERASEGERRIDDPSRIPSLAHFDVAQIGLSVTLARAESNLRESIFIEVEHSKFNIAERIRYSSCESPCKGSNNF